MHRAVSALLLALTIAGCEQDWDCAIPDGQEPAFAGSIGCQRDRELLWNDRDDAVFARTSTINWIIDREDSMRVYFLDTEEFPLHYDFARIFLDHPDRTPVGTHAEFNLLTYRREDRRFMVGKLMHYHDQNLLTIELSAGDTANVEMIEAAYDTIAASIFDGDRLRYRAVSATQEELLSELQRHIPIVRTEAVFAGQVFQPLNRETGFGTLRFARVAELAAHPVLPTEIVVLDRVPNDISMVSGIVTEEFQTPLSHINILSKNRGTPNMALRDAFNDPALRALEGKLVRLEVTRQEHIIAEASAEDAQAFWDALRPTQALVPEHDLDVFGLPSLDTLGIDDVTAVGSKAANMAEMMRIESIEIPVPDQPFAIPFSHYAAHISQEQIPDLIEAVIVDAPTLDPVELQERLFAIRWAIFQAPLAASLRDDLVAQIAGRWGQERKIRFRSSSNAEDLLEFSGAGLYTSASGKLADGSDAIANALKVAWASAWNYQAFVEREFYRVDHREFYMGVLVHPAFVGETANGVAVTINDFNERRPAFYINSQISDISVTNPTGIAIPEQLLYYLYYEEPEQEIISHSSLTDSAVLSDDELEELAAYLEQIHNHFRLAYAGGPNFAMDVEFKLDSSRQVIIKQARPIKNR